MTAGQAARRERAFDEAAQVLADAHEHMARLYQQGGAMAVAEAAWLPGGPSREQLARDYESWVQVARARQAGAAA